MSDEKIHKAGVPYVSIEVNVRQRESTDARNATLSVRRGDERVLLTKPKGQSAYSYAVEQTHLAPKERERLADRVVWNAAMLLSGGKDIDALNAENVELRRLLARLLDAATKSDPDQFRIQREAAEYLRFRNSKG